ncbi:uncharacterized protein LOC132306928 [Cornus florida]|uniref:uncharacterized protein LOC132306928 n=1 Tax=Cornus florida TaxID=4283 RepID=UPI00289E582E|nr:uncharacterized protein LOC132306928 [Cornus florida]
MGFNSVYKALQEVFPQLDARILRAVAIEHSKDADAAVEAVLVEVIPYISKRSPEPCSSNDNGVLLEQSRGNTSAKRSSSPCSSNENDVLLQQSRGSTSWDESLNGSSYYDINVGQDQVCGSNGIEELTSLGKREEHSVKVGSDLTSQVSSITLIDENDANDDHEQVGGNTESEVAISVGKYQESSVDVGSDENLLVSSTTLEHENRGVNGSINDIIHSDCEGTEGCGACHCNMAVDEGNSQDQSCLEGNALEVENSVVQLALSPVQEETLISPKTSDQLVVVSDLLITGCEKPEPSDSLDVASKEDTYVGEMIALEDESTLNTSVTRSGQICRIDLLENIIEDARSNKKTLFSAVESVISLMREVEDQENAAEQAKEEAIRGGLDILTKVEDLKKMLHNAKEANDMHAGEVYGEKAILATEVKELQSRLLSLSDERDKSLAILDEMRQTLELRLAAAEKVREAAEQERLEKVKSAQNALAEQELVMEKVVEESKILKQEAEENSKLQEFLVDRGRVVDMLQGEISVICQDVLLLKEKFDERVPLSKSLSSSQTSCILASSGSSLKSLAPDQVPEQDEPSETPTKTSPNASVDDQLFLVGEGAKDDGKALVEDGWEFFDNREFYI